MEVEYVLLGEGPDRLGVFDLLREVVVPRLNAEPKCGCSARLLLSVRALDRSA